MKSPSCIIAIASTLFFLFFLPTSLSSAAEGQQRNSGELLTDQNVSDQSDPSQPGSVAWLVVHVPKAQEAIIRFLGNKTYTFSSNYRIPANISIHMEPGANLHVPKGATLTIDNRNICAGKYPVFSGLGDFNFAGGSILFSSWFHDFESAVRYIGSKNVVLEITQPHIVNESITVGANIYLKWDGPGNFLTLGRGATLEINGVIDAGPYQIFSGNGNFLSNSHSMNSYPQWWHGGEKDWQPAFQKAVDFGLPVEIPQGNYPLYRTLIINKGSSIGGKYEMKGRWTGSKTGVLLEYYGPPEQPAILIAGEKGKSPLLGNYGYIVEGFSLHDIALQPADKQYYGIVIDGAKNKFLPDLCPSGKGGPVRGGEFSRVHVRKFGKYNWYLRGNVFDLNFYTISSFNSGSHSFLTEEAESNGLGKPSQLYFYGSFFRSINASTDKEGPYAVVLLNNSIIYGGNIEGGNGASLGFLCGIYGAHIEGHGTLPFKINALGKERRAGRVGVLIDGWGAVIDTPYLVSFKYLIFNKKRGETASITVPNPYWGEYLYYSTDGLKPKFLTTSRTTGVYNH